MCDDDFLGLMCDLSEGKIVSYNESNFNRVNKAAEEAAKIADHPDNVKEFGRCLGICYAFGNSISLVLEKCYVSI